MPESAKTFSKIILTALVALIASLIIPASPAFAVISNRS